jgi:hypothetical protein
MNTIAQEHKAFQDANSRQLNQAVVNYAMLAGDHNKVVGMTSGVLQTAYQPVEMDARNQTLYTFDRIEQAMRNLAPSLLEAIPGIGVVPTTSNPVKSENADTAEKFVEYHRDNVWDSESFFTFDMLQNGYPGGSCYVMMYPRHVGMVMVAHKDGQPYLTHNEKDVIVNSDESLNIGGETVDPSSIGCTIEKKSELRMDLKTLTIFDVSVQGKINKSMRDCTSFIVRCTKSLGTLLELYPEAKEKIVKISAGIENEQEKPPLDGIDEWLGKADFPIPKYGKLKDNQRIVEVYQKFINPCYDYPSGAVQTVAGLGENYEELEFSKELPWKHHKTRTGLPPVVWFPFSLNKGNGVLLVADPQKAEGAQRAWDRVCNASMVGLTYKASPPIWCEQGTQFSVDGGELVDRITYPKAAKVIYYKLPPGQNPHEPKTDPSFGGQIDPQMLTLMERQLNIALNMSTGMEQMPKTVSGESFQAQWTVDQRDLMPLQKVHQNAWFELYELLIGAATTVYYDGQKFLVPEKDRFSVVEFKKEIFGDDFDYKLVSKINKPVTKKARLDIINLLVDMYAKLGTIPPEIAEQLQLNRLFEALDIEELGLMENEVHPSLIKAKWELAKMCSGNEVKPPLLEDAHKLHMAIDLGEMQSVRFTTYTEKIQELIREHSKLHRLEIDAMNKIEQKAMQTAAMEQEAGRAKLQQLNQPKVSPGEPMQEPSPQPI